MTRAYKYRLYPTVRQEQTLRCWLRLLCELYNAALQERRDAWNKQHVAISRIKQENQLAEIRKIREEFETVSIIAMRGVVRQLDNSFSAFFRRYSNGETPGYPRFKTVERFRTIFINDVGKSGRLIAAGGNRISVPLIGKIKFKQHRPIQGHPKVMRITLDGDGHWYVTLMCVDVPEKILPATGRAVGVDLGLLTFAATSDGKMFANPRPMRAARIHVERAQRRVSKRKNGSNRRHEAVKILRRAHHRAKQVRRQNAIDVANALVRNNDLICVEKLNIEGLTKGQFSRSVRDAGWGNFLHWLRVKAESAGREVVEVNPCGTSQICSRCGVEVRKDLSVRVHDCPSCGLHLDRDVNAARNILALGLSARRAAAAVRAQRRPAKSTFQTRPQQLPSGSFAPSP